MLSNRYIYIYVKLNFVWYQQALRQTANPETVNQIRIHDTSGLLKSPNWQRLRLAVPDKLVKVWFYLFVQMDGLVSFHACHYKKEST